MINLLNDPLVSAHLACEGLSISREADLDWRGLRLKPGDVVYVPRLDPERMGRCAERGFIPPREVIPVVRYTWKAVGRGEAKRESAELYPWTRHHLAEPVRKSSSLAVMETPGEEKAPLPLLPPEKVFFTADTHFFDERVLHYRTRFPDVETMNETLVENWNATVPPDGIVFHLGDFMTGPAGRVVSLASRLNGTILLVKGNHDDSSVYRGGPVRQGTRIIPVGRQRRIIVGGRRIELCHYPFLCYSGQYSGVWQLFGHVHSGRGMDGFDLPRLAGLLPFQYDVGVDNNDDSPVPFARLEEIMSHRCADVPGQNGGHLSDGRVPRDDAE